MKFKTLLASLLLGFASFSALAFEDFTIDEGSVAGANDVEVTGDKLNGGYTELLTINADFTFDTVAYGTMGQLFSNDGTVNVPTQMSCGIAPQCYNLYFLFEASGNVAGNTFTGATGSFSLYIDPSQDSTFAFSGGGGDPVTVTDAANDDYLIATATTIESLIGLVGDPGAFDFVWSDFTLTAAGELYFIDPDPFHVRIVVDGDFDEFPIAPGDIRLTGDVSAVFVPEPGTLAIFGLGMLGLGLARRRQSHAV